MKKWLTLLWAFSLALCTYAQQKFFEEPIGWHGKSIELHTISDREKQQSCLFLCNDDSIRAFLLDNKQAIIQRFYLARLNDEKFLGGFIKDNKVYVFLQPSGGQSDLHVWSLRIAEGDGDDYTIPFEMRHERSVEQISCGDHFLYFAVNRRTSQFIIYDFKDNKQYDTLQYQFEPGIWKALTSYDGGFSRDINVTRIDADGRCNPDIAHIPNKLYWLHDTLFLLMNGFEKGVTNIFSFDLRSKQVGVRKIVHNNALTMDPPLIFYQDNSMLLDEKLYFVSGESNKLDVQVRDFYSGGLLKEYTTGKEEEITFKNTPIIQEGSFYKRGPRELSKTRQFLRKMVVGGGSAVMIASREDSGRTCLTIGAYQKMVTTGGGGGFWSGGAVPGVPMVYTPGGVFFRDTYIRSSRFKMQLDSTTLQHVPGEISGDIGDRIEQYTDGISIPPAGEILFRNNGKYVYAYYNRDEHKIMLVDF